MDDARPLTKERPAVVKGTISCLEQREVQGGSKKRPACLETVVSCDYGDRPHAALHIDLCTRHQRAYSRWADACKHGSHR
eukprot:7625813-Pyramimonas_sp.AAC.1